MADCIPYGSDVSAGIFECADCGNRINLQSATALPSCPHVQDGKHKRRCWYVCWGKSLEEGAQAFKFRLLRESSLSEAAIDAAWPDWWSEEADQSKAARAELRFTIARRLGLDPTTMLDEGQPRFQWDDFGKYKNFRGEDEGEKAAISSFGTSVTRLLARAAPGQPQTQADLNASRLRKALLSVGHPWIGIEQLLVLVWSLNIPTVHLRVHPSHAKRMAAMSVSLPQGSAILVGQDAQYPAWSVFHIAHEIGHIALGHTASSGSLIDMDNGEPSTDLADEEEKQADAYALELLAGDADFHVEKRGQGSNPGELANKAQAAGYQAQIEPGTFILCYAKSIGEWQTAGAALKHLFTPYEVWRQINGFAEEQLGWELLTDDEVVFLKTVLGMDDDDR